MPRPVKTWLWPDTHFFHDKLEKEGLRPKGVVDLMMKNARYVVAKQDILIHLGDVIFYKFNLLQPMLDSIPCSKKILLMGNHDRKTKLWYMRNGFDYAVDMLVIGDILLSHRPQPDLPPWIRLNIHGHLHDFGHRDEEAKIAADDHHRLIALESNGYMPVDLQTIS